MRFSGDRGGSGLEFSDSERVDSVAAEIAKEIGVFLADTGGTLP
jgi:hypothetical protein